APRTAFSARSARDPASRRYDRPEAGRHARRDRRRARRAHRAAPRARARAARHRDRRAAIRRARATVDARSPSRAAPRGRARFRFRHSRVRRAEAARDRQFAVQHLDAVALPSARVPCRDRGHAPDAAEGSRHANDGESRLEGLRPSHRDARAVARRRAPLRRRPRRVLASAARLVERRASRAAREPAVPRLGGAALLRARRASLLDAAQDARARVEGPYRRRRDRRARHRSEGTAGDARARGLRAARGALAGDAAMTLYAVGDLQGCAAPFDALLEEIRFDPERDRLWLVGDLVNRGPSSLATLRRVMELGDAATTVLGNHDLHLLAAVAGVRRPRPGDTFADVLAAPDARELVEWLRHRPLLH